MTAHHEPATYSLAFDHRGYFRRALFGDAAPERTAAIADAKALIFDGLLAALDSGRVAPEAAGVLVDEQYGADVARRARERGIPLAMPVESSDGELFEFEYGDRFGAHIERFDPDFAKALVRFNPDGEPRRNELQLERLRAVSDWLRGVRTRLLVELIVVPTPAQLDACGEDRERFQAFARPGLAARAIAAMQEAGIEAGVWKLEGVETTADADALVAQARSGPGRERVVCVVLGAGAGRERVERWLDVAAAVEGFTGFAIGRSIWDEPVRRWLEGTLARGEATALIASRYLGLVERYERALKRRARRRAGAV